MNALIIAYWEELSDEVKKGGEETAKEGDERQKPTCQADFPGIPREKPPR
jgi:hypothetical protein